MRVGERLDQVEGLALDEGDDVTGHLGVVDGVGEVVAGPGRREVDLHDDVDDERSGRRASRSPARRGTPWREMPLSTIWSVTVPPPDRLAATRIASSVDGHVVDPHAPRPSLGRVHRGRGGGDVALERAAAARRPSATPEPPEERLARGAHEDGVAEVDDPVEVAQQATSCGRPAWRSRSPGRAPVRSGGDPARHELARRARTARHTTSADHVVIDGPATACRALWPRQCIATKGTAAPRPRAAIVGVGHAAADVVDDARRRPRRPGGHLGAHGVDGDHGPAAARAPRRRAAPGAAPPSTTALGAGPGGLATDVEDVSALGDELAAVRDGGGRLEPLAAVAERVGGHVDDPHDDRQPVGRRSGQSARAASRAGPSRGQVRNASASRRGQADPGQVGGRRVDEEPGLPLRLELGVEAVEALDLQPAGGEQQHPPPGSQRPARRRAAHRARGRTGRRRSSATPA